MSPISDAVIPVGGLGTRLLPATRSQPKEMLPIVDKPVVQCVVEELVRAGQRDDGDAGSGGAIVGACRDGEEQARVMVALSNTGCGVLAPAGEQEG